MHFMAGRPRSLHAVAFSVLHSRHDEPLAEGLQHRTEHLRVEGLAVCYGMRPAPGLKGRGFV